ncbi:MAG: alanine racemase, partial [Campylobacterales bacterium]|nr:alanine racemase [Campylobacterales bacterium]
QCPKIKLKGVMSIGAMDERYTQKSFEATYRIYETLPNATICSMGMSGDYELAIKCGSNLVRVGSSLFKGEA